MTHTSSARQGPTRGIRNGADGELHLLGPCGREPTSEGNRGGGARRDEHPTVAAENVPERRNFSFVGHTQRRNEAFT